MNLKDNFFKYFYFENKIIYLIIFLPPLYSLDLLLIITCTNNNFCLFISVVREEKIEFNLLLSLIIIFLYLYLILNSILLTQTNEGIIRAVDLSDFIISLSYCILH